MEVMAVDTDMAVDTTVARGKIISDSNNSNNIYFSYLLQYDGIPIDLAKMFLR